ncbi:MAG: hypothetical protein LBP95_06430 [Deltaproteobacteria bacterium]|nr:hypothetical protein [Deltaproteobacteria bacterium]
MDALQDALAALGKHRPEDEINCSGCGYRTCRELAAAVAEGHAGPEMCVSNMRRLAARKASALVRAMPSALVMVDRDLSIIEFNEAFVSMFLSESDGGGNGGGARPSPHRLSSLSPSSSSSSSPQGAPALTGKPVTDFVEFGGLLKRVLRTGTDIRRERFLHRRKLFNVHIFSVEKFQSVGAIVTDVTSLKDDRLALARKVRDVIDRNIATVQEIACLLGEHMVETESILSAVAEDYESPEPGEETGEDIGKETAEVAGPGGGTGV